MPTKLKVNDEWKEYKDYWQFLEESYEGGIEYTNNEENLFPFRAEISKDYKSRLKRAVYLNYCKPIVDEPVDYIFKSGIQRLYKNDILLRISQNFDGTGQHVNDFMRELLCQARITGKVGILIDKPAIDAKTSAEEIESGLPYANIICPDKILAWSTKKKSGVYEVFNWISILEEKTIPSTFEQGEVTQKFISVYNENEKIIYRVDDKSGNIENANLIEIERIPHNLGLCPVIVFNYDSAIQTIAYLNRLIYNWFSMFDDNVSKNIFSMLAIPSSGLEKDAYRDIVTGNNSAFAYQAEMGTPSFIQPGMEPCKTLADSIFDVIAEMYSIAGLQLPDTVSSSKLKSGIAHIVQFMDTNSMLATWADNAETMERQIVAIMSDYMGIEFDKEEIIYPDQFNIYSLDDEINQLSLLQGIGLPESISKELLKQIVRTKLNGKMAPEIVKTLMNDIDDFDEESFYAPNKKDQMTDMSKVIPMSGGVNGN